MPERGSPDTITTGSGCWVPPNSRLKSPGTISGTTDDSFNLAELIPEHFGRFFEFFKPGHLGGIVPTRIKELARLKIAALNQCDT